MKSLIARLQSAGWPGDLVALIAGALLPLALAPFNYWALALVSLSIFFLSLDTLSGKQAWRRAFAYLTGLYGVGASWVFVSIHEFGQTSFPLALTLISIFVLGLAALFSPIFYLYGRYFHQHRLSLSLILPLFMFLNEWLRGWLFTGFPWLYSGYASLDTLFAGFAPVLGVLGTGIVLALVAGALASALRAINSAEHRKALPATLAVLLLLPLTGWVLQKAHWTELDEREISVGMVQPNIPQELKWSPLFLQPTLDRLTNLSEDLWHNDWLIWPEASVPLLHSEAGAVLEHFHDQAVATNTALITGILYDEYNYRESVRPKYFNSVYGLGTAMGTYYKQRLVPFGEYVPLEQYLRGLIAFFDLPTSIISPGQSGQRGIQVGELMVMPSLCYEIAYPDLVAIGARKAEVLLTLSNDAWFGDSIGPLQHMQMARFRALETGRFLIRATNNGVSAVVDPQGRIIARSQQFIQTNLQSRVRAARGHTPYMQMTSEPIAALTIIFLLTLGFYARRSRKTPKCSI